MKCHFLPRGGTGGLFRVGYNTEDDGDDMTN